MEPRPVSHSHSVLVHWLGPTDANSAGFVHGAVNGDSSPSSTCGSGGLLDYPHYTRPSEFRGLAVPEVLSSGNHDQIRRWRRRKALEKTVRNRPDLLDEVELSSEDRVMVEEIRRAQKV